MVYFTQTLVFFGFHRNIELKTNPTPVLSHRARREPWERGWLKTNKHEFVDIIHQNKQGFDGKKLSEGQAGRNSLCFNNLCCRLRRIGDRHAKILTVLLSPFSCLFSCYPPESFKIICLTCICSIWLKFVDTSFHSSQKPRQINPQWRRLLKNRCVKLKTLRELELSTYLAKSINFLWAKFGGNRK